MEIDITSFFENAEPFKFSHSIAEGGRNAGPNTWRAALEEASAAPLLTTPEQINALRDHMHGYGAWEDDEINAWPPQECNALFIQLVSSDMREADLDAETPDWDAYERGVKDGRFGGAIFRSADRIYYGLSD
jgi:hypothetical protein